MSTSKLVAQAERAVRTQALGACTKVALVAVGAGFVVSMLVSGVALALMCLLIGAGAAVLMWRHWGKRHLALRARYEGLTKMWVNGTRNPVEASRRRELLRTHGVEGAVLFITDADALEMAKVAVANMPSAARSAKPAAKGRQRVLSADDEDQDAAKRRRDQQHEELFRNPYEGMVSGNGMPLSATGLDVYGDSAGSTANHDYMNRHD